MPRKEDIPLEERLERAKYLHEQNQEKKRKKIAQLHSTEIYKLARKSCIAFLWITQLLIIDWILPYYSSSEKVVTSSILSNATDNRRTAKIETYVWLNTSSDKQLEVIVEPDILLPQGEDSIQVLKSYLLRDLKKVKDLNTQQEYIISNSLIYQILPVIIMFTALSLLFLFIENIEVKAFYYFMLIGNTACLISIGAYFIYLLIN